MKQKLFGIGNWFAVTTFIYFLWREAGPWGVLLGFGMCLCGVAYMYEISYQMYLGQEKIISALRHKLEDEALSDRYDWGGVQDDE